jgi:hypothetical protein
MGVIRLADEADSLKWHLTRNGVFSVKSMYDNLRMNTRSFWKKYLRRLKVPLNIKIFMCLFYRKVFLLKITLQRYARMGVLNVGYVILRKPLTTFLSHALLLILSGE